jgi:hypothetical protein
VQPGVRACAYDSRAALQHHHQGATHRDACSVARRELPLLALLLLLLLLLLLVVREVCGRAVAVAVLPDPAAPTATCARQHNARVRARAPRAQGKLLLPATPAGLPSAMWAHAAGLLRAALLRRSPARGRRRAPPPSSVTRAPRGVWGAPLVCWWAVAGPLPQGMRDTVV